MKEYVSEKIEWSDEDLWPVIALLWQEGVGRKTIQTLKKILIKTKTSWLKFLGTNSINLEECGFSQKKILGIKKALNEHYIETVKKELDVRSVKPTPLWDATYPMLLAKTADPPLVIFTKGNISLLEKPLKVAVVGTRKPTGYGKQATKMIGEDLAKAGVVVVSGGMFGVDWCAHQAVLDVSSSGDAQTIAVLGYGFDHAYPASREKEFKILLEKGGLLITEYPPFVPPIPGNFPVRNRIVAGLCQATVVVEAAPNSGSMITAQCAVDEGRNVGVVPSSIMSPYVPGVRHLVSQGAFLVTRAQDIFEECNWLQSSSLEAVPLGLRTQVPASLSPAESKVWQKIILMPLETEVLVQESGLTLTECINVLGILEMKGLVIREGDVWRGCLG